MHQQHITHQPGHFAPCRACQRQPKHIASIGTHSREPLAMQATERHHLECNPCGRRTSKHPTPAGAAREWDAMFGNLDYAIPRARKPLAVVPKAVPTCRA